MRQDRSKAATGAKRPLEDTQKGSFLELNAKTVGVIALGTAIINLVVQGGTAVVGGANAPAPHSTIGRLQSEGAQLPSRQETERPTDFLPTELQAIGAPLE